MNGTKLWHKAGSVRGTFRTIQSQAFIRFHNGHVKCFHSSSSNSKELHSISNGKLDDQVSGSAKLTNANSTNNSSSGAPRVSLPNSNRNLRDRLPDIPHIQRPTREELLAAATGFWSRMKVRFKWFSIRSVRPFNADEIGAFFSWFLLGHVIWIIVGTTTFFSLAIFAINTVFAQETLARWVGNYFTRSSGIKVVFESAIVPRWGDGVITFKNVFVSRRPGQGTGKVSKGSPSSEAAAAAAAVRAEKLKESGDNASTNASGNDAEDDGNYTQFDLALDTVNVTLSFTKWFNSKGLLRDVEIKGVRGVIDRTSVHYSGEYVDPRTYKHEHNPGDFEIDSFKLEDLLVTVHQPHSFRPFSVSVFSCDLPQLRRQWLFYDFLSANMMSGSFDDSLFTIHPRQIHGHVGTLLENGSQVSGQANPWKKHSRFRIDGLNIDHLNRGVEGPFSWIREGNVDIVADIMIPADNDESIAKVMSDFYDRMEATVTSSPHLQKHVVAAEGSTITSDIGLRDVEDKGAVINPDVKDDDKRFVIMDLRVHLNDIRAAVPIFTKDLSYAKNALVRPIVAYMNSRHTFIPINCRVVKRASEFDGSWTIFDSGLMDDLSAETYEAFAKDVTNDQARLRRFKKVGLWSLQLAVQALFMGLAGNFA
ncbi:Mitochondrial distribution and morphology protein 31, mitochondrial precursor [Puttea exsequens]|nr:Mitochondrial distribution and morphology protein 31, mitochondrial precursor [Puttea exsequens]